MRLDTLCLWRNTWLTNRAMIFFQITYLRDRRLGNLISLNHRLLCLPAACFIIVIILSFVLLTNDTWIPNTKGLYKSSEEQSLIHFHAQLCTFPFPILLGFTAGGQRRTYHGIIFLFFMEIYLGKMFTHKQKDVRSASFSCDLEGEDSRWEKELWFGIPIPYILSSNLALKSPWKTRFFSTTCYRRALWHLHI